MLNVVNVVDVSSPSALHVCNDGVKDVTADATTNKVANHAIVTMDIATVMEEILHENENKAVDFDVITDVTEGTVDEALRQAMAENNDGHATGKEIVATGDENVVEQVSHITIHE